jgi:hypothetical protein
MATQKIRILRTEDQKTREEYLARVKNYTDEDAHKLGYSNVHVLHLEDRLGQIAEQWRTSQDVQLVSKYRETLYDMILHGYDVDSLPLQDQLPKELMPELPPQAVRAAILQAYDKLET